MKGSGLLLVICDWLFVIEYENIKQIAAMPDSNNINLSQKKQFISKKAVHLERQRK
jgi:hypothetical protein